ncbi:MAG: SDR family NAD(P)-dependent oxidoreductase [Gammaproteobacteria bacterium]
MTTPQRTSPAAGRLAGRVAIVTGGTAGLGAAIVDRFLAEGACVVFTARGTEAGRAREVQLQASGLPARYVAHDVASERDWSAVIDTALAAHGRLDVLVNNAGTASTGSIELCPPDLLRGMAQVNLHGCFLGVKLGAEAIRRGGRGGAIVNIASIAAGRGFASSSAYCATKAAVVALSRVAALELAPDRIRVNTVIPGFYDTPLAKATALPTPEITNMILQIVPMRRVGHPRELAALVLQLASDEGRSITGAAIAADAGVLA